MRVLFAIFFVLLSFSLAAGEMYQWVDKNGVITFKDTPPPPSKKHRKVKVYSDGDFDSAPADQALPHKSAKKSRAASSQSERSGNARFNGTVEIYVTSWCGYCEKALAYLKAKHVPYVAYDIEKDSAAEQRHRELGGRGVPLIVIGSNKMYGFSAAQLDAYLNSGR